MTVFLDITKAFDVVHHGRLLMKLKEMGLTHGALVLLSSYLYQRECCTLANNQRSSRSDVEYGVPQGSILGPLLFLIYINDIPTVANHGRVILYADDLVIVTRAKDPMRAQMLMQEDISSLSRWCELNRLTPNLKKSKGMWFAPDSKLAQAKNMSVTLNNEVLHNAEQFKYLGVWLDCALKFKKQLDETVLKTDLSVKQFSKDPVLYE